MPAHAHHFIPVWPSTETEKTHRSREYGPSRKRKRLSVQEDSDDEDTLSHPDALSLSGYRDRVDVLATDSRSDPYRVAGHPRHLPPPNHPFPHAPVREPRRHATAETTQRDLAALKPALYVPPPPEHEDARTSLRRHHISVMTTIMHTSLLRGDYVRAGRAWGMILRTEVLGRSIDLRTHGRWGIGAEILLRQHTEHPVESSAEGEDDHDANVNNLDEICFTKEGFELAVSYYKRLILQYPYQKNNPNLTNDLDFLPAMYGLEIYEIQQRYKRTMKLAESASASPSPLVADEYPDHAGKEERSSNAQVFDVKQSVADMVIDLAGRMDEPMLSPPYNTYAPLVQLRAMVSRWIVDLIKDMLRLADKIDSRYDSRLARETDRARRFVEDVKHRGGKLPEFFALSD